ncbi:MAG: hypothetical protein IPI35_30385 [Deltaproteobacteria bacterium]|nr:hypothetical protein [Deltaproteobacteria bacterium]
MQHPTPQRTYGGMWVAFPITSVAIAFFVARLAAVARDRTGRSSPPPPAPTARPP